MKKATLTFLLITIFILTILLSSTAFATINIDSYTITSEPINQKEVHTKLELILENTDQNPINSLKLHVPKDAQILSIKDSFGDLNYQLTNAQDIMDLLLNFDIPFQAKETRTLTITMQTQSIVQKANYFEYLKAVSPSQDVENFEHILKLSKDAYLYELSNDNALIFPQEASIEELDDMIIIRWKQNLKAGEQYIFLARFGQDLGFNYWKTAFFTLLTLILIVALIFTTKKIRAYSFQKKAMAASGLLGSAENQILKLIIQEKQIKQYELVRKLGFNKSRVSKIIKKLELRELISIKKEGKVKIIGVGKGLHEKL